VLDRARRVLVLTGAGISAESGIPTFRGPGGLWRNHRPEELATPEAFRRDPRLVWEWYAWRREIVRSADPGSAHRALARWLLRRRDSARLVTQNVDGLHARAQREESEDPCPPPGESDHPPERCEAPLELHGSLFRVRCTGCGEEDAHHEPVDATSTSTLPRCGACAALLRPAVVWFGEMLPEPVLQEAFHWAGSADAALVVGTSALVHPAASLPLLVRDRGGALIEVNPVESPLTPGAAVSLRAPAGSVLPEVLGTGEPTGV
jgi:NAD-dependent deacetylase